MGIGFKNRLAVGATPVPDVFIDTYMAGASGEYVKVYLYLLRHQQEEVSIGQIADALNRQYGLSVPKQKIVLEEPIKTFGVHRVKAKLYQDIAGEILVQVVEA